MAALTPNKLELQERAQLVRELEATCKIEYPSELEAKFRLAVMKKLGCLHRLKEMRGLTIDGPAKPGAPIGALKEELKRR